MRILELKQASLASFFELIENQPGGYRNLFRGQRDASWGLVPSLYRLKYTDMGFARFEENYHAYELKCIERFFNEAMPYLPPIERGYSNDRILAQHFGVPTRLLDWTRDPLVALFFAVESYDRDTDTEAVIFMIAPDAEHRPEDVRTLRHNVIAMTPPAIDRRIPAQKSVFTFHPYGPANEPFVPLDKRADIGGTYTTGQVSQRGFAKIVISRRVAFFLRQTLMNMGVDRRNLFPGLDGVGMDIGARAQSGQIF